MKLHKFFVLVSCLFVYTLGFKAALAKTMTLEQFITMAEKFDPNFENILADKKRADFVKDLGMPSRQYLLSLRNEFGFNNEERNTSVFTANLSKEIVETGTTVSVGQSVVDRVDRTEKLTEVRLQQSLYRNFLGRDSRLLEKSLVTDSQIIQIEVQDAYEQYINEVAQKYLDYSQAQLNYDLSQTVYREILKFEEDVKKRFSKSVARSTDADRASLQVIISKEDMLQKQIELESAWQEIQKIIGPSEVVLKPESFVNLEAKYHSQIQNENDLDKLRVVQAALLKEQSALQKEIVESRKQGPAVDLIAGYNLDNSERFNTPVNREEFVVGLRVDIPLGDTLAQANTRNAALTTMKAKLEVESIKNQIKRDLATLKVQLDRAKEKLNLSKKKVALTERILKDEERRYTYGGITLDRLIEIKNDFAAYRFQYQNDLINYNRSILDWVNLNDRLF